MVKKKSNKKKLRKHSFQILDDVQSIHFLYEKKLDASLSSLGISNEQYNVLRILAESPEGSLALKQIQSSLPNQTSNTTRLVEKLRLKKLVVKKSNPKDRRLLHISMTEEGQRLLTEAEKLVLEVEKWLQNALKNQDVKQLSKALSAFKKELL